MTRDARTELHWTYRVCPIDAPEEGFGPLAGFVSLWRERMKVDGAPPGRGDFEAPDFRPWMGRVFIARIERDPFAARFSLWGTTLARWWQVDYTGKLLGSESKNPGLWDMVELEYLKAMDRTPFIGIASGFLDQHDRSHVHVASVDLPLFDDAGLSHVISAHVQLAPDQDVAAVIPNAALAPEF
jgi:hypothetical protein